MGKLHGGNEIGPLEIADMAVMPRWYMSRAMPENGI